MTDATNFTNYYENRIDLNLQDIPLIRDSVGEVSKLLPLNAEPGIPPKCLCRFNEAHNDLEKSMPDLTILIPTYNRPGKILRAIQSVLDQSNKNCLASVFDNSETDETKALVELHYGKNDRVHYFKHPENIGGVANFAFAMANHATPYFSFLADDDIIFPWFVETVFNAFKKDSTAKFVCGRTLWINELTNTITRVGENWAPGFYEPGMDAMNKMADGHFISTGVVFSQDVKAAIGTNFCGGHDRMFMINAAARFPFIVLSYDIAVWYYYADSFSGQDTYKKMPSATKSKMFIDNLDTVRNLDLDPMVETELHLHHFKNFRGMFYESDYEKNAMGLLSDGTVARSISKYEKSLVAGSLIPKLGYAAVNKIRYLGSRFFKPRNQPTNDFVIETPILNGGRLFKIDNLIDKRL